MATAGRQRSPIGRAAQWTGVTVGVFVFGVWAVSLRWIIVDVGKQHQVSIFDGCVAYTVLIGPSDEAGSVRRSYIGLPPGREIQRLRMSDALRSYGFLLPYRNNLRTVPGAANVKELAGILPLWIPVVAVTLPTGVLFWPGRGRVRACCCVSCGYDLTGNVSGICPECGTPIREDVKLTSKRASDKERQ
jgi:hypothetical protein